MRALFEIVSRKIVEGLGVIVDKRVTVWIELPPEDHLRSHSITFSLDDRGILWADADNEEEARAFRAFVALR